MRFFHTPNIIQKFFPQLVWRVKTDEKILYLSFDDGPTIELSTWILDTLKIYHAKAMFFCVGENLIKHPEFKLLIEKEGHIIANHSYNHLNGWHTKTSDYIANVEKCEAITANKIFRPPYGLLRLKQMRELLRRRYKIILWDILPYDFDPNINPEIAYQKILNHTKPGSIIVLHDNIKAATNLKYLLPRILEHYTKLGYTFNTI